MKCRLVKIEDGSSTEYSVQRKFLGIWWNTQIINQTSYETALAEFNYYKNYKLKKSIIEETK